MKFIGIIPARYASTRFPGKPLADMKGKYMIQRVYEQACKVLDRVCVATDDERIFNAVQSFGGQVVMTSLTVTVAAPTAASRPTPTWEAAKR